MGELEDRQKLVQAMPGFVHKDHFEALNRASLVFGGNLGELDRTIRQFVGTDVMAGSLDESYEHELSRVFHNFLAAVGSLRDVQRMVHRKVWNDYTVEVGEAGRSRMISEWEHSTYSPMVKEAFGTPESSFIQDLRNYALHRALPVPNSSTNISWTQDGPVVQDNRLRLDKNRLMQFKNWSSAAKGYIKQHDKWVDFLPAVEAYSKAVRSFYAWMWDELVSKMSPELPDFKSTHMEWMLYQSEEFRFRDWKFAGRPTDLDPSIRAAYRNFLEAKRDRWAHGSRGWGTLQQNSDGQWIQIEQDPWGLPPRSCRR